MTVCRVCNCVIVATQSAKYLSIKSFSHVCILPHFPVRLSSPTTWCQGLLLFFTYVTALYLEKTRSLALCWNNRDDL